MDQFDVYLRGKRIARVVNAVDADDACRSVLRLAGRFDDSNWIGKLVAVRTCQETSEFEGCRR